MCAISKKVDLGKTHQLDHATPLEELEFVPLFTLERQVSIGTKLGATEREELIKFLQAKADVYT